MEIKLQDSFKNEITGKALVEYINRKDSCGYHDVTPEQFTSVVSAVLHALESYEDFMKQLIGVSEIDLDSIFLKDEKENDKLQDKNSIETKLDRYCRQGNIDEVENIFFSCEDDGIKLKAGKFLIKGLSDDSYLRKVIGKELKELEGLNEIHKKVDEILYKDLEPIKNKIREGLKLHAFHGSDLINLNGDVKEDTKKMFEYVMNTTDIYDKAYVMKSVLDRVLSIYFETLKEIDKEINGEINVYGIDEVIEKVRKGMM